ncbi:hypothetical protein PTTG_26103 [Puccinia triticina 1-1 BBBD Race 1]|uniref:B30.2/SPRY domain-containing protein n=1 Tax=Puccinia triticina (isolate 1-1 / race 1 (BBBD)) TaxID=630390 RepID=A0A180GXN2_PUCT1|nr:hypothetical protein PTTG_26103 [Puccinia triticina 1-1 BBBD Race 1]
MSMHARPSPQDSALALLLPLLVLLSSLLFLLLLFLVFLILLRRRRTHTLPAASASRRHLLRLADTDGPLDLSLPEEDDYEGGIDGLERRWLDSCAPATRNGYLRAKMYQTHHRPNSLPTDITLSQFLSIQEKGVSAWAFEPDYDSNPSLPILVQSRTEIVFLADGAGMAEEEGGGVCVQSNLPLPKLNEVYYFECKIYDKPDGSDIAIGLATKPYPSFRLPGWNRLSIGYFSADGFKSHNYPFTATSYGPPLKEGDVLGVGYRPRTGTVFFTRNGKKLEDAYVGLHRFNLFPTVGATGPASVHVNLGQAGFVFIEANVKNGGSLPWPAPSPPRPRTATSSAPSSSPPPHTPPAPTPATVTTTTTTTTRTTTTTSTGPTAPPSRPSAPPAPRDAATGSSATPPSTPSPPTLSRTTPPRPARSTSPSNTSPTRPPSAPTPTAPATPLPPPPTTTRTSTTSIGPPTPPPAPQDPPPSPSPSRPDTRPSTPTNMPPASPRSCSPNSSRAPLAIPPSPPPLGRATAPEPPRPPALEHHISLLPRPRPCPCSSHRPSPPSLATVLRRPQAC